MITNISYEVLNRKNKCSEKPHFHPILGHTYTGSCNFLQTSFKGYLPGPKCVNICCYFVSVIKKNVFLLILIKVTGPGMGGCVGPAHSQNCQFSCPPSEAQMGTCIQAVDPGGCPGGQDLLGDPQIS